MTTTQEGVTTMTTRKAAATKTAATKTAATKTTRSTAKTTTPRTSTKLDPYAEGQRIRREQNNVRGPGKPVSDKELAAAVRRMIRQHPDYSTGKVQEALYWFESLAISRNRVNKAWEEVTGEVPARAA